MQRRINFIPGKKLIWRPAFGAILLVVCLLSACAFWATKISYYDPVTYKSVTDIKPEILQLYDSFGTDNPDSAKISSIRLRLSQMIEYENGKGEANRETTEQIKNIKDMFERHVLDRRNNGMWGTAYLENCRENITELVDMAISTEQAKNRKK